MSAFDQRAPASSRSLSGPPLGCAAGVALAAAIEFLVRHIAPEAPAILGLGLAGLAGLAVIALAFTLEDEALPNLTRAVLAGMGLIVLGALADPEARLRLFSFASAAFGVGLTVWLARTARRRPRVSLGMAALFAAALAGLSAYAAVLVLASRDLMIADFMTYRGIAIMVARLADAGNWPLLMSAAVESITQNYSWAPALAPGVMLALTAPTSRALYTVALLALYAAPALLALAILARDLARRGGLALSPSPQPSPKGRGGANGRRQSPSPFGGRWREAPDEGALATRRRRRVRRLPGGNGGCGARHARRRRARADRMRAATGRAPRPPARAAQGPQRARRADDAPRRFGAAADDVRHVRLPALVCVRRGGNRDRAGDRNRLDRAREGCPSSLERRGRGGRARPPDAARAHEPGHCRLAAEFKRA